MLRLEMLELYVFMSVVNIFVRQEFNIGKCIRCHLFSCQGIYVGVITSVHLNIVFTNFLSLEEIPYASSFSYILFSIFSTANPDFKP